MIDVATLSVIRRWALREQLSIRECRMGTDPISLAQQTCPGGWVRHGVCPHLRPVFPSFKGSNGSGLVMRGPLWKPRQGRSTVF